MDAELVQKAAKPRRKCNYIAILAATIPLFILLVLLIICLTLPSMHFKKAKCHAPVKPGVSVLPLAPKTEPAAEVSSRMPLIGSSSFILPRQFPVPAAAAYPGRGKLQAPQLPLAPPRDHAPPPQTLRQVCVVSYNIRCNKDPPPFDLPNRIKHIAKVIDDLDCDVVCLQEATELFCSRIFKSTLSAAHWQATGRARRRNDETTCIVYRTDIFSMCHESTYVYSDNGPFLCAQSYCQSETVLNMKACSHVRIFTHVILKHIRTGKIVNIVNTHFPLEEDEQRECFVQLGSHVAHNIAKNEDLIIVGDFNSHFVPCASTSPFSILYKSIPDLDEVLGMRDEPTFTEGFQSPLDDNCHRLDFIFFRRSMFLDTLLSAEVYHPRYQEAQYRPSDHEPILARFQVM